MLKLRNSDFVTNVSRILRDLTTRTRARMYESKNIPGIRSAGVDDLYHDECMQEVAGDHIWTERSWLLLEYYRHDVIADVSFTL